jgi:hypothetical protein
LFLNLGGGSGVDGHVGVETGNQGVSHDSNGQSRGSYEGEESWTCLGDAFVEDRGVSSSASMTGRGASGSGS